MYDSFYELKGDPFRLSPDHNMAFAHKRFAKARAYMSYAFMRAEGFVMVTGRPGTGKTTLVGVLKDQLTRDQVLVARLVCTQLQADDLLKVVCYEFGVTAETKDKGELLQQLSRRLKAWDREGRRALLIVDEAQNLSITALEELRLLTNLEADGRPLLQIFLLGQTELRDLILRPELEQVHQRLVAATHLEPLEQGETEDYVRHRLDSVGWRGNPAISNAVYPLIFKFSEGIPRRINLICSRLFLHGAVEQKDRIGVVEMRAVVQELQSEGLAVGSHFSDRDFQVADEFEPWPVTISASESHDPLSGPVAAAEIEVAPTTGPTEHVHETSTRESSLLSRPDSLQPISPSHSTERNYTDEVDAASVPAERIIGTQRPDTPMASSAPVEPISDAEQRASRNAEDDDDVEPANKGGMTEGAVGVSASSVDGAKNNALEEQVADPPAKSPRDAPINAAPATAHDAEKSDSIPDQGEHFVLNNVRRYPSESAAKDVERKDGTSWFFALFLLLSVGLVMWAVYGFKLPFAF